LRKSVETGSFGGDSNSGGGASKDPFERAKKANMFGNELDPEIHSLHHYLKHFIISRGSKAEQVSSAASTSSEKVTFTEYQVCHSVILSFAFNCSNLMEQPYQGVRVALPGCVRGACSHSPEPQAAPTGASNSSESPRRNEDDEHSEDAATTIVSLDTINDIGTFTVNEPIKCPTLLTLSPLQRFSLPPW
jgi:hypothetical protein